MAVEMDLREVVRHFIGEKGKGGGAVEYEGGFLGNGLTGCAAGTKRRFGRRPVAVMRR